MPVTCTLAGRGGARGGGGDEVWWCGGCERAGDPSKFPEKASKYILQILAAYSTV